MAIENTTHTAVIGSFNERNAEISTSEKLKMLLLKQQLI